MNSDITVSKTEKSVVATCPSCGGNMVFDPEAGNLKCPYCNTVKAIESESNEIIERCFVSALAEGAQTWEDQDIQSFSCKNCGAQLIFDQHTQAQFCNYCGSSNIALQEAEKTIPPQYLIPFKVTEKAAGDYFKKWIKKRWFAPNDLKKTYQNEKLLGTYIPHWTYDSITISSYTAERGDYYYVTKTREVDGKTETYEERNTRWTSVSGYYSMFFDDILVRASNKVDSKMIEAVQPFDLDALTEYTPEFLSGFYAERYSIPLEEGWEEACKEINRKIYDGVEGEVGGDKVRSINVQTQYANVTFKHILLPLWLSTFNYKSKVYHFMINGQTGKVVGKYPKSLLKIALAVLAGVIIIGGIAVGASGGDSSQTAASLLIQLFN